jgi:asparagine synthase (glutamine-hydrolysing)
MCGILGIFDPEGTGREDLLNAASCIDSRGPDDEGYTCLETGENLYDSKTPEKIREELDGNLDDLETSSKWLAHKRLDITGEEGSHQPMNFQDLWIAFEGEIYNYREIREELRDEGYSFDTAGDTEIFLKAYSEWKEDALDKLRGKWVVAFYSEENEELVCYTDRFGTKPLYYTHKGDMIGFSSMIKPLLELEFVNSEQNEETVLDFLKYGLSDHRQETFFQDVKRLRAGEKLVYDGGKIEVEEWHAGFSGDEKEVREVVRKSFERHAPEEKFALTLSGGLDSTILASQVKERDVEFFSISLPGSGEDEKELIESVEDEYDIETGFLELEPMELVAHSWESIEQLEEPVPLLPPQAQSLLFDEIEDSDARIILQGSGSDELFCGYEKFIPFHISDTLKEEGLLKGFTEFLSYRKKMSGKEMVETLSLALPKGEVLRKTLMPFRDSLIDAERRKKPSLYECETLEEAVKDHLYSYWFPFITRIADKNSAPRGLEVRAAYLDADLRATALEDLKANFQEGETKYLLRDAFREALPEKILSREQKQGFVSTDDRWMTSKVRREFLEVFGSESFQNRELVNSRKVERKLRVGELGFREAYRFYQYEIWMREFID